MWTCLGLVLMLIGMPASAADPLPEFRVKAAFVFNFLVYTEWPVDGGAIRLCLHGADPFGKEIDALQGKFVGGRPIVVMRRVSGEALKGCQAVFIASPATEYLPRVLELLQGHPTLTIADSPGAARQGAMLNLGVQQGQVGFEANLSAVRSSGLALSSRLLHLAREVLP